MKIDLKKLSGVHGSALPFSGSADLSQEMLYGEFPFQTPVQYQGKIVNHLGVLSLQAVVRATYATHCARCFAPLQIPLEAAVQAVLSREDAEEEGVLHIDGDTVEVEDALIPELLLQVRMTYLCKEDCKGLCPVCGVNRNVSVCSCQPKQIDPRLAGLAALLKDKPGQG